MKCLEWKCIKYVIVILMTIQIVLGMVWMMRNITCIPTFGDSTEYLELSQSLMLDEYRPILYPLILRYVLRLGDLLHLPYQVLLYLLQTIISYFSIFYTIHTTEHVMAYENLRCRRGRARCLFISTFIMSIPMVTFMNFSVLTDSLATSFLLLYLSGMMQFFLDGKKVKSAIIIGLAIIIESLLRADRLYSCLVLFVIFCICRIMSKNAVRKQLVIILFIMLLSIVCIVKGVDKLTQTPGCHGRIATNFEFILLDRIVWPNMEANYNDFSDEIKNVVTIQDARTFDEHNNNVMYQMAPLVEAKVGKETAGEIYKEMTKVVLCNQPLKVLKDIGEDIFAMTFTPVSSLLNVKGYCEKGDSWNIYCMSTNTELLTKCYNSYFLYLFILLLVASIILMLKERSMYRLKNICKLLKPFIGMSLILTLWFSLGDGAPPNDRYAIIIYICWVMIVLGIIEQDTIDLEE